MGLRFLNLANNQITEVTGIESLSKLNVFHIRGNPINKLEEEKTSQNTFIIEEFDD